MDLEEFDYEWSYQFDCDATVVPSGVSGEDIMEACKVYGSVLYGLEGDPEEAFYIVRYPGRPIEAYTKIGLGIRD